MNQYIENHEPDSDVGFFTYAIIRCSHYYHIFDSHGHLRLYGRLIVGRGMVITFPDLSSLIGMLQGMYGLYTQCDIAPMACKDQDCRPVTVQTDRMCRGLHTSSSNKFEDDKINENDKIKDTIPYNLE
ncbi:hypothetical protein ACF0H5_008395 [Mactra antiquata]